MFFCNECATAQGWPESWMRSFGPCEVCGRTRDCSDIPSKYLPDPTPKEDN